MDGNCGAFDVGSIVEGNNVGDNVLGNALGWIVVGI